MISQIYTLLLLFFIIGLTSGNIYNKNKALFTKNLFSPQKPIIQTQNTIFNSIQGADSISSNSQNEKNRFKSFGFLKFDPKSELLNGRLAMFGITIGLITEQLTGKTLLEQIGLNYDSQIIFLISIISGSTIFATSNLWDSKK